MTTPKLNAPATSPASNGSAAFKRLVRLWRKEARDNLGAEWAYKNQKPISLNRAAFEEGLALAKQQCADQLKEAVTGKPTTKLRLHAFIASKS